GILVRNAHLSARDFASDISGILDSYSSGSIGDKKLLRQLDGLTVQYTGAALAVISGTSYEETHIEGILLRYPDAMRYFSNLIGIYFNIINSHDQICSKIQDTLLKFIELEDIDKFNAWLYKEADWNKEAYGRLVEAGYSPLLWEKGVRRAYEVANHVTDIAENIERQTRQILEVAKTHSLKFKTDITSLPTLKEAQEFADEYILHNPDLPDEVKTNIEKILKDTKRLERAYQQKLEAVKKVTVEVHPDFLKDSYCGVGVPGCFNPLTGPAKKMPFVHALEADATFMRFYDENNKMIANAVLVFTPQGVVVQPIYNASNLDLDRIAFDMLAHLVQNGFVKRILLNKTSAGFKGGEGFVKARITKSKKINLVDNNMSFDIGNNQINMTKFKTEFVITKKILDQNTKPGMGQSRLNSGGTVPIKEIASAPFLLSQESMGPRNDEDSTSLSRNDGLVIEPPEIPGARNYPIMRNIKNHTELVKSMLETIISMLLSGEKVVLAFHKDLKGNKFSNHLFRALEKLGTKPGFDKFFKNLVIVDSFDSKDSLMDKLNEKEIDLNDAKRNIVFTFAPLTMKENLANMNTAIRPVFVNENSENQTFDADQYYYPLFEIVLLSLIKYRLENDFDSKDSLRDIGDKLKECDVDPEKLNIKDYCEDPKSGAFLIINLIPKVRKNEVDGDADRCRRIHEAIDAAAYVIDTFQDSQERLFMIYYRVNISMRGSRIEYRLPRLKGVGL
ncbi:MAG: hypothetical protein HZA72_02275, partial [Candidatus Omnitrophica bacterium]|nr:hypothetical protein [Candidatus Omnitrophota bacterium]